MYSSLMESTVSEKRCNPLHNVFEGSEFYPLSEPCLGEPFLVRSKNTEPLWGLVHSPYGFEQNLKRFRILRRN